MKDSGVQKLSTEMSLWHMKCSIKPSYIAHTICTTVYADLVIMNRYNDRFGEETNHKLYSASFRFAFR